MQPAVHYRYPLNGWYKMLPVACCIFRVANSWTPAAPTKLRTGFYPPDAKAFGCELSEGITLQWAHQHPAPPNDKGVMQTHYHVQILSTNESNKAIIWDTGKVAGATQNIVIGGHESPSLLELPSGATLYWRVRAWLESAATPSPTNASAWSVPLAFDTAPLRSSWDNVSWVGGYNQMRANFSLFAPIKRARVYAAGVGAFYLYINGQRASDNIMDPPQSVYPRRTLYMTYDVTTMLVPDAVNIIGAQLGNYKWGYNDVWCNMTESGGPNGCRALALRLVVEYDTSQADTVLTTFAGPHSPWFGRQGPISWDHFFHGETFDARLDINGWSSVPALSELRGGATAWAPVSVMTPAGTGFGPLVPTNVPPLRACEVLSPVSAWPVPRLGYGDWNASRAWIFDFGKNSAGMMTLRFGAAEVAVVSMLVAAGVKSLQIEHSELVSQYGGSTIDGYCQPNVPAGGDVHMEPCVVHQTYPPGQGHLTPDRYIGDFNDANMTNVYVFDYERHTEEDVSRAVEYTPYFAAAGFRFAKVIGLPDHFVPTLNGPAPTVRANFVHTDVRPIGNLVMAPVPSLTNGFPPLPAKPPAVPSVCGASSESDDVPLLLGGCPGGVIIDTIPFVSFGTPIGDCRSGFVADSTCDGKRARGVVEAMCVGRSSCSVKVSVAALNGGVDPCYGKVKTLAVLVHCTGASPAPAPVMPGPRPGSIPSVLNVIHEMTRRSQLSNLWSIPTDCPQRERRGWMGDAQVSCDAAMLSFDMQAFYRKFLRDVRDDQLWGRHFKGNQQWKDDRYIGSVADVVPFDGVGGWPGCPVWQVAYIVIARTHWRHYGDKTLLSEHWDGLVALMDYFERHVRPESGLLEQACYGDWIDPGPSASSVVTPSGSVTAFYFVLALKYISEIATALGKASAALSYGIKHNEGVRAYHARFYNAEAGGYSPVVGDTPESNAPNGSQTSNAMALALGAPQNADKTGAVAARVAANLLSDFESRLNHSFGGIVGQRWIYPALEAAGYGAHALDSLRQETFPSFGRMVQQNQTTLCENWKCTSSGGGGSHNHIMYGGFNGWLTTALGGLDTVSNATSTAWRVLTVRPLPAAIITLGHASVSIETRFGVAALAWNFDTAKNHFSLNITVPVGSVAEVYVPAKLKEKQLKSFTEAGGGKPLEFSRLSNGTGTPANVFLLGSGVHDVIARFAN